MIREDNSVVITCMDSNYEKNILDDFLFTLRNDANYNGRVIILDYGMTEKALNSAKREYCTEVYKCVKDRRVLFSVRNRDLALCIKSLPSSVTHVMSIDGADVWFQAPFSEVFELCKEKVGYIEGDIRADRHKWTLKTLNIMGGDMEQMLRENFKGTKLKNAGMMCGPRELISSIAERIFLMTQNTGMDFFGLDQLFFNYILNSTGQDKKISLPKKFNYLLIDNRDKFIINNKKVYDEEGCLVSIVHNAGGTHRVIKKDDNNEANCWMYKKVLLL